jgi:hypothetical protein
MLLEDKRRYELGSKNIVYIEIKKTDEWNSWNNVIRKRTNKVKNFSIKVKSSSYEKYGRFWKFNVQKHTLFWCKLIKIGWWNSIN